MDTFNTTEPHFRKLKYRPVPVIHTGRIQQRPTVFARGPRPSGGLEANALSPMMPIDRVGGRTQLCTTAIASEVARWLGYCYGQERAAAPKPKPAKPFSTKSLVRETAV